MSTRAIDSYLAAPAYSATIATLHALWWRIPFGTVAQHAVSSGLAVTPDVGVFGSPCAAAAVYRLH